jgi:hypothetical protein
MTTKSKKLGRELMSEMAQPVTLVTSDLEEPTSNLGR